MKKGLHLLDEDVYGNYLFIIGLSVLRSLVSFSIARFRTSLDILGLSFFNADICQ